MTESIFLRTIKGKPYLVYRTKDKDGRRHDKATPLSAVEQKTLEDALRVKDQLAEEIVEIPCMNPRCPNTVKMTRRQLEEFLISSKKRYDIMILPFCSTECREKMLNEMQEKHGGLQD